MAKPTPKFFRICTSGKTIDGRVVSAEMLTQAAETYDPEKYGARINLEHMRSLHPDGAFRSYGDVIALKTETNSDGDTVLLAQIDPTKELVALNKERQKIYTSAELKADFKGSGKWYLVGLAVTDSPASTGTEALKFSLSKQPEGEAPTLSEYVELTGLLDDDESAEPKESFLQRFREMLSGSDKAVAAQLKQQEKVILELTEVVATQSAEITALNEAHDADRQASGDHGEAFKKLQEDFNELKASLEQEESGDPRPPVGSTDVELTDC